MQLQIHHTFLTKILPQQLSICIVPNQINQIQQNSLVICKQYFRRQINILYALVISVKYAMTIVWKKEMCNMKSNTVQLLIMRQFGPDFRCVPSYTRNHAIARLCTYECHNHTTRKYLYFQSKASNRSTMHAKNFNSHINVRNRDPFTTRKWQRSLYWKQRNNYAQR